MPKKIPRTVRSEIHVDLDDMTVMIAAVKMTMKAKSLFCNSQIHPIVLDFDEVLA